MNVLDNKFVRHYKGASFTWLFVTLLVTIGIHPLLDSMGYDFLWLFMALNLVGVMLCTRPGPRLRSLVALSALYLLIRSLHFSSRMDIFLPVGDLTWIAASIFGIIACANHIFKQGKIDREKVFAALDLYLLAGILFATCYRFLDLAYPASFNISSDRTIRLDESIYFSFVTIATLGYGDIYPVSSVVRGFVIVEAVGGQIYLAVLVARLVSLFGQK